MPIATQEREESCKTYFLRSRERIIGLKSGLDPHFFAEGLRDIWSSFDALLTWKFPGGNNTDQRKKFAAKYQASFPDWRKTDLFKNSIKILMGLSPVKNMDNGKEFSVSKETKLLEILNFSYTVRSNLNHGAKHLVGDTEIARRNRELVEYSFKITYDILEKVLPEEGIDVN